MAQLVISGTLGAQNHPTARPPGLGPVGRQQPGRVGLAQRLGIR